MSSAVKTQAQHTPGPWEVDTKLARMAHPYQVMGQGHEVASICGHSYLMEDDEPEANARLIAAAPDMYEALKALVRATVERDNPRDMGVFSGDEEVVAAQAAIAKAEGRQ